MQLRFLCVLFLAALHCAPLLARANTVAFLLSNNFTASENALTICDVSDKNADFTNCKVIESPDFVNPVSMSYSSGEIFIVNYGRLGVSGTSFGLKCRLDSKDNLTCRSIFARASAYHLNAIKVVTNKLFFVEAYAHSATNISYLVACDLKNSVIDNCGIPVLLRSKTKSDINPNTSVDIVLDNDKIYVTDPANKNAFQCSLPDLSNQMTCEEDGELAPVKAIDLGSSFACESSSQKGEYLDKLTCCVRSSATKVCGSRSGGMLYNPTSLSIDNKKNIVYLTNANSQRGLQGSGVSKCELAKSGEILGQCRFVYPNMQGEDGIPREFSRVLIVARNTTE